MTPPTSSIRSAVAVIPIAVAHPIADLVIGVLRPATILATHSAAIVLCVEPTPSRQSDDSDVARVITLLTREASGVPNGARTALSAADRPFSDVTSGDAAFVGNGSIRIAGRRYQAVRTVRTGVPHISAPAAAGRIIAAAAAAAPCGVPAEPVLALRDALDAGDPAVVRRAVRALVGLGSGSTPGGDDVLAGALAALLASRRDVLAQQIAAAALPDIATRTPLMSADLLRLAAAGHVCLEAGAVLRAADGYHDSARAIVGGGALGNASTGLQRALGALLAVGHTSGADLATGMAIGLGVAPQPAPRRPRQSSRSTSSALSGSRPSDRPSNHPSNHRGEINA